MYEIDKSVIEEAVKCDRNHECLTQSEQPSCKICHCINNQIHFVEKLERLCPYYLEFGYGYVCNCPVRKEIFNLYGE